MSEPTQAPLALWPIGRVIVGRAPEGHEEGWEEAEALIEIDAAWAEALDGIEGFSHIWVLWWLDRAAGPPDALHVRPERRADLPLVGLFATRSPRRPNPIAMTAVRLVRREGTRLYVVGLDAFVGTPILDVKPYLLRGDQIAEATAPDWLERLWQAHDADRRSRAGAAVG
jgi:tRNA-Thr(GGU) m(6)t(6)A37 methyltransferase TsaA